jgi:malate dehydrogenase
MAVASDGSYGIGPGLIYSYPVTTRGGEYAIVPDLAINAFSRERMELTRRELEEERAAVEALLA